MADRNPLQRCLAFPGGQKLLRRHLRCHRLNELQPFANEVAIGMILPRVAAAMLEHRLTPSAYQRAAVLSQYFSVEEAKDAGFFDELVDPGELMTRAQQRAAEFEDLDVRAHTKTKRRIRAALVRRIRWSIPLDLIDAVMAGLRRARSG